MAFRRYSRYQRSRRRFRKYGTVMRRSSFKAGYYRLKKMLNRMRYRRYRRW